MCFRLDIVKTTTATKTHAQTKGDGYKKNRTKTQRYVSLSILWAINFYWFLFPFATNESDVQFSSVQATCIFCLDFFFRSEIHLAWNDGERMMEKTTIDHFSENQSKNSRTHSEFQSYFTVINHLAYFGCDAMPCHALPLNGYVWLAWYFPFNHIVLFDVLICARAHALSMCFFSLFSVVVFFFMLLSLKTTKCVRPKTNHGSSI